MPLLNLSDPLHPANIVISAVESQLGSGYEWQRKVTGVTSDWCAATVVAAGIYTNLSGTVFPKKGQDGIFYAGMCGKAFETYGGKRIDGPLWGKTNVVPSRGDMIIFVWKRGNESFYNSVRNGTATYGKYSASHIGMVTDCRDGKVYTIEGNCGGSGDRSRNKIAKSSYSINSENISFYVRPDWSRANGVVAYTAPTTGTYSPNADPTMSTYQIDGTFSTQLYTTESTKADASIREVAYLGKDGKPCINMTGVRLAVVNYTGLLNDLYRLQSGGIPGISGSPDNIDGLDTLPRTCVQYLTGKGFNTAAAIGIIANIKQESDFRTNCVGDHGTSFGICQWHNARGRAMIAYVGSGWENNLSGQLDFLLHELDTSYSGLVAELKQVPNTLEGAKHAADRFVRVFERPANVDTSSLRRQTNAENFWSQIVTTSAATNADYSNNPTVQKSVTTPPWYLTWPVPSVTVGKYTSGYGYRGNVGIAGATTWHNGVDIGGGSGASIVSCGNGKVCKIDRSGARGHYVVIDHGNKFYTLYQHMQSRTPLSMGATVLAGQEIGKVGNTGLPGMAAHLHLEVHVGALLQGTGSGSNYRSTSTVDPAQYFPKLGSKT